MPQLSRVTTSTRRPSPLAMPEFFAPLPLLAVGLMVLNDRVLKPRLHNALSGKLSDVAGCFFLPLFVSALLGFVWSTSLSRAIPLIFGRC